jgi:phosphoglycolate phosphatase-like HAD superfamily hydrolase
MKKRLKKSQALLIFDFDGTIADTKSLYYDAIKKNLKKFGINNASAEKLIDLGTTLKIMLAKLGLSKLTQFIVRKKVMNRVKKNLMKSKQCHDVRSISHLKSQKILVTNSLLEFVMPLIKKFKLKKQFLKFYGAESFGDKGLFIKDYMEDNNLNPKKVYYIGDRVADVKVAKKAKCQSIIIAGICAWDSKKDLIKAEPDFIISDIGDLIDLEKDL